MKRITLFFVMLGFFLTANAQYDFNPIAGPTTVAAGLPVTINLNDVANTSGVPASSSGSYNSFLISVDWVAGGGNPFSIEAVLTLTTTAGSITVDPPTLGGAANGNATTLIFGGALPDLYDPTTDGFIDLLLDQTFAGSNADWNNIVVTLFETPTCPEPSDMVATGVTATTADLGWTVEGSETLWNIEYSSVDFTPGNGEEEGSVSPSGTPNTTLTGLTSSTNYFVYYQASCGASDLSLWVGPFIFATECVTLTAPYTEGFENAGIIPLCWSMDGGEDWLFDNDPAGEHIGNNGVITGSTASNNFFAWADSSGNDGPITLTSPLIDVSGLAVPALSFYEISDNEGNANSTLDVEVWDGAAWNNVATYNTNTSGWELKVIDLSTLTITGDIQARFIFSETVSGDFYDDIAIDDVTFDEAPSCFSPSALTANAITTNSALLSWTQDGTVSLWNIEIVPAGTAPTGTPTASDVSNPYTATGLAAITNYDYYVQANCGSELSTWTGPFTFETMCDIFIPDYIENFTTIIPDCWDEADNGDATSGPTDLGASSWNPDEFLNIGAGDGAYSINLWLASKSDWLLSPQFDLTGGPFQVEFDFGIMQFASSDTAGTLGSDDIVQLLMTTDNGATWITLLTYDNTSVVSATGEHPVVDLTAYSGQTVQFGIFASEGTVDDTNDNEVFVDNFRVRGIPTCPEPTDLTASNLSLTSTEVGWTEAGTSTSWNIEYGETGFALGTGTVETDVTANPFVLTGLMPDTSYEFYVQAICDVTNLSSFAGPFEFFTGYCESIPSSNDGDGVANVTIGVTNFPSLGDVTYEDQTSPVVNVFQGIDTNVSITFATGFTYDTNIWIDFNDDLVFDDTEIVYQGVSTNANPTTLDASFIMPATAPIGEHRMRIGTADFGQATPDPCFNGPFGVTLDFTVNVQELTCTLPEADFSVTTDCNTDQFFIDVNVTSLGDATSLEISNDLDATTLQATAIGLYQAGPFPFGSIVKIFVTNEQDNNCVIGSQFFEILACPPDNDECDAATVAVVNDGDICDLLTPGTILAATPSSADAGSCVGIINDDVWFEFTALSEVQIISILNITGGTTNLDHALYEGSCGALTELSCSNDTSSVTPSLTVGNTYYLRIFSAGSSSETSNFDLCIREAPTNIICDNAENFCSVGGSLVSSNIIGIPDPNQIACLGTAPNPTWNIIQIGEGGLIEIEIAQTDEVGNGLDVDFVLWGPFDSVESACSDIAFEDCPTCPNNTTSPDFYPFGNIVDCSYSFVATENLTIDNALPGEIYMLLVTNFSDNPGIITITQTNSGSSDGGTIEAEISAEIVSDEVVFVDTDSDPGTPVEANVCGFNSVTIETNSPFADVYEWYKDGFVIAGETSSSITVTESDNYQVRAFDNQCGAEAFSQIVIVNLYDDAGTIAPQNITACDGPVVDGSSDFDLEALSTSLGLGDGFIVSYYTSMADANQAINAVGSPYNSSGETLIIRVEDADAATNGFLGCRQLSQVDLVVNPIPTVNQPADFVVCDDIDGTVDGVTEFDLASIDDDINTDTDVVITYHISQGDADAGTGALTSPYSSSGETIYARAENTTTGCYNTTSFNLEVNIVPLATFDPQFDYEVCPNATVPVIIGIVPTNFTVADVTINWFLDGILIAGANGLSLDTVLVSGDYSAEITFNTSGCVNTLTTFVMELESCIIPQGISPNADGFNDNFDLSSYDVSKLEIFNRNGRLVYSKNNYTNEWVGQTNDGKELPVGTYFYTMEYEDGTKKRSAWIYINR